MRIQDMMSKQVIRVAPATSIAEARERLRTDEISHLVVMDGKRLAGVISEKDLHGAGDDKPVAAVMSRRIVTIEPTATVRRAAGILRGRGIGCLPVLDDGALVGILTTSDILTALAKGEIHAAPPRERTILRSRVTATSRHRR